MLVYPFCLLRKQLIPSPNFGICDTLMELSPTGLRIITNLMELLLIKFWREVLVNTKIIYVK